MQDDPLKKAQQTNDVNLKVHLIHENEPLNEPLTGLQVQMINFIRTNPKASYDDLTETFNKGRSTIMRNIQKLKDAGLLSRVGSKKNGHWEV